MTGVGVVDDLPGAPEKTLDALAQLAESRRAVYELLAGQLLQPPPESGEEIAALRGAWRDLAAPVDEARVDRITGLLGAAVDNPGGLLDDYQELFVIKASRYLTPVESAYRGARPDIGGWQFARLKGPAWEGVRRAYAEAGFAFRPDVRVEEDHLACELMFLGALCEAEASAASARDMARLQALRESERRFLEDHPAGWIELLRKRAEEVSDGTYYCEVIRFVETFLQVELGHVGAL